MRRIVVTEFVTLDGVLEDPGGGEDFVHGGWSFKFPGDEGMQYKLDEVRTHAALLLGRVTYEGSRRHGRPSPTRSGSPTR